MYSGGSSGRSYGVGRSDHSLVMYGDVITIEIDHKTRKNDVVLRFMINDGQYSDYVSLAVGVTGDVSLAVAINSGETDYIQLIM